MKKILDACSWGDLTIGDVGMREMVEVRKAVSVPYRSFQT